MYAFSIKTLHWLYKLILSPFIGNECRFMPTCSDYALKALLEHGFFRGSLLSLKRFLRCNPWCKGGCDPVPIKSISSFIKNR